VNALRRFGSFWWDFVVGDDWIVAAGVVLGLAGVALLDHAGIASWWLLPVVVAVLLALSVRRVIRGS
jgi:hypothetical protein